MNSLPVWTAALALLAVGCESDSGVKVFNASPAAEITSHDDGDVVKEATDELFRGIGSDPDHNQSELEARWESGSDVLCDWLPLGDEGVSECVVTVASDLAGITFLVRDPRDSVAATGIYLGTTPDAEPEAEITSPSYDPAVDEEVPFFWGDEPVELVGVVFDDEDAAELLAVEWTTSTEEELSVTAPDSVGTTRASAYLSEGLHTITLTVTDSAGNFTADTLDVQVGPDNPAGAPDVMITDPAVDAGERPFFYGDQPIQIEGFVADDEDAAETIAITWSTDTGGDILTATPNTDGTASLTVSLDQGLHTVILTAVDSDGQVGSDSVDLEVGPNNTPPSCELVTPEDGETRLVGEMVVFGGTVSDPDIPADTLTVEWKSGEDVIGSSIPTSAGNVSLPVTDLGVGAHVISMTATDEMGATCTDQITFVVREPNNPPTVSIASPLSGSVATAGDPVLFDATIGDAEDAPNELLVEWTSDIDGVLSTASADSSGFSRFTDSTMTVGMHAITLTVTDTEGAYTTQVVIMEVEEAPVINTPPTVSIVSPIEGAVVEDGVDVAFNAVFYDAEDAPDALTIVWTSSIDGVLTGAVPDASGVVSFSEAGMSVGTHVIIVTVTDSGGLLANGMVVVNVAAPGDDEDDEEFIDWDDDLPPELEGGTYSGCADFDLDNLVIFGAIDAALFCACGFDTADNVKISSSGDADIDLDCLDLIEGNLEIDLCGSNTIDLSSVASVGDGVNIHDNYDTEVIDMNSLSSVGGNVNISNNVDLEELRISALETVDGQLYVGSNNNMPIFSVPNLRLIEGNLEFSSNNGIEEVHFDGLDTVEGQLRLEYNNSIQTLSLPVLTELDGRLHVNGNYSLETIVLGSLLEAESDLYISDNRALENVVFTALQSVNGSLQLQNAHQMNTLELPELLEVNGSFNLSYNDQLEWFAAPLFYDLAGSLTIRDNSDLSVVDLSSLECIDDFTVVGNDMLPEDLHALLLQLSCDDPGSEVIFRSSDATSLCADGDVVVNDLYIYAIDPEPLDLTCIIDITGRLEIEFSDAVSIDLSRAAGVGNGVNIHDNYNTEAVYLDSVVSTGSSYNVSNNLSLETMTLSALTEVGGTVYMGSNNAIDVVYAPELTMIEGDLEFSSNNGLDAVDMPNLAEIEGQLRFEYNNAVEEVLFPDLEELNGRIHMNGNYNLQVLDLMGLTEVGSDLYISDNRALETITLTNLESVNGSVQIQNAHQASTLEMPMLLEVNGSFNLSYNDKLDHFGAPLFHDLSGSLTIRDNKDLRTVDLSSLECIDDFTIVGNDLTLDSHHALLISLTCRDGLVVFRSTDADEFCATGETVVNDVYISPIDSEPVDLTCITGIEGEVEVEFAKSTAIDISNATYIGSFLNIHDNYDTESIDFTSLETIGGNFNLSNNRDLSTISIDGLLSIDGRFYLGSNNNVDELAAPALVTIEGELEFSSNNGIEDVRFDSLSTIEGQLRFEYNNGINSVSMPVLTNLDGRLHVNGNYSLETIDLGSLPDVGSDLYISDNRALENVVFTALQSVNGSLQLQNAHQVSAFVLPALLEVNGSFNLSYNDKMESFSAPMFNDLSGGLTIRDNGDLASVDLTSLTCVTDYTVVGNDLDDDDRRDLLLHIISDC